MDRAKGERAGACAGLKLVRSMRGRNSTTIPRDSEGLSGEPRFYICLLFLGLFNGASNCIGYTASYDRIIWINKDVEGGGHGRLLKYYTLSVWRKWLVARHELRRFECKAGVPTLYPHVSPSVLNASSLSVILLKIRPVHAKSLFRGIAFKKVKYKYNNCMILTLFNDCHSRC